MTGLRKTMKNLNGMSQPSGIKIKPKIFLIQKAFPFNSILSKILMSNTNSVYKTTNQHYFLSLYFTAQHSSPISGNTVPHKVFMAERMKTMTRKYI
jgi:hypothetical protein